MHDNPSDELRILRERAYGPNPDIHEDAAALERLNQLELEAQSDDPTDPVAESPVPDAGPLHPDGAAEIRDEAQDADDSATADPSRRTDGWSRGRWAWLWAGALTLALIVGAALTYASLQAHPGNVGMLQAEEDAPWPQNLGNRPAGSQVFEEFHGLQLVLMPQMWAGGSTTPCLFIVPAIDESGVIGAGCGAGAFEPTAAIEVTGRSPAALLERFEEGTSLQFILRDGEVVVYSRAADPAEGAP